jgi:hypothetical protein
MSPKTYIAFHHCFFNNEISTKSISMTLPSFYFNVSNTHHYPSSKIKNKHKFGASGLVPTKFNNHKVLGLAT